MSDTPAGSRVTFVAVWIAIVASIAVISLGTYLSTQTKGASFIISVGAVGIAFSSRALRRTFGAASFATGAVRARALTGFVAALIVVVAAFVVLFLGAFIFRRRSAWWDAPLCSLLFLAFLTLAIVSYRFGVDYTKRERAAIEQAEETL